MDKEILTFRDIEIEKKIDSCFLKNVDIAKALVFNKISSGGKSYKYFIGYSYKDYKVSPLHVMLPKTSAYIKSCDGQTK